MEILKVSLGSTLVTELEDGESVKGQDKDIQYISFPGIQPAPGEEKSLEERRSGQGHSAGGGAELQGGSGKRGWAHDPLPPNPPVAGDRLQGHSASANRGQHGSEMTPSKDGEAPHHCGLVV